MAESETPSVLDREVVKDALIEILGDPRFKALFAGNGRTGPSRELEEENQGEKGR